MSMLIKCKRLRRVALFAFFGNIFWLIVMLSVLLCACITRWCQIIFPQLEFLRKTCEEPNTEHLVKMVCSLVLSFVHIYTYMYICIYVYATILLYRKVLFVPGEKACSLVTLCIFHSFVWAGRSFYHGEWIRVSVFFNCGCWLVWFSCTAKCDSSSSFPLSM